MGQRAYDSFGNWSVVTLERAPGTKECRFNLTDMDRESKLLWQDERRQHTWHEGERISGEMGDGKWGLALHGQR